MTTENPMGDLAAAVCAVMAEVGYIQKTGENQRDRYKYASDADLLRAIQPAMAKAGLCLLPVAVEWTRATHERQSGGPMDKAEAIVTYRLIHSGGGSVDLRTAGCGTDTLDKAVYKAMTGAYKYVLRQTFAIPLGNDPDEAEEERPASRPKPAPARAPKPETARDAPGAAVATSGAKPDARHGGGAPSATTSAVESGRKHDPSWEADRARFCADLLSIGWDYDVIAGYCEWRKRGRPSTMPRESRSKLLVYIQTEKGSADLGQYFDHLEAAKAAAEVL